MSNAIGNARWNGVEGGRNPCFRGREHTNYVRVSRREPVTGSGSEWGIYILINHSIPVYYHASPRDPCRFYYQDIWMLDNIFFLISWNNNFCIFVNRIRRRCEFRYIIMLSRLYLLTIYMSSQCELHTDSKCWKRIRPRFPNLGVNYTLVLIFLFWGVNEARFRKRPLLLRFCHLPDAWVFCALITS